MNGEFHNNAPPTPNQLAAITSPLDQPAFVIAGPGSGKTKVIVERFIHLITKHNIKPDAILFLTFSNSASSNIKLRLQERLKQFDYKFRNAWRDCGIYTTHAFARDEMDFKWGFGVEKLRFIKNKECENILQNITGILDHHEQNPKEFKNILYSSMAWLANHSEYPSSLCLDNWNWIMCRQDKWVWYQNKQKHGSKAKDIFEISGEMFAKTWKMYVDYLYEHNLMDYPQQLIQMCELLGSGSEVGKRVCKKYQYVLVDESQDLNKNQLSIVLSILKNNSFDRVFFVGDMNQSIYGFQGSMDRVFEETKKSHTPYKDWVTYHLDVNYRTPWPIFKHTQHYIKCASDNMGLDTQYNPNSTSYDMVGENTTISILSADETAVLMEPSTKKFINSTQFWMKVDKKMDEIKVKHDCKNEEIVILCRSLHNGQVMKKIKAISNKPIKEWGEKGFSYYFSEPVVEIVYCCAQLLFFKNADPCKPITNQISQLSKHIKPTENKWRFKKIWEQDIFPKCNDKNSFTVWDETNCDDRVWGNDVNIQKISQDVLAFVVAKNKQWSYIGEFLYKDNPQLELRQMLLDMVENIPKSLLTPFDNMTIVHEIQVFVDFIFSKWRRLRHKKLKEIFMINWNENDWKSEGVEEGKVNLMTMHNSKGLEFKVVIVVVCNDMSENLFLDSLNPIPPEDKGIFSEQKLLYVSMTRAEQGLYIYAPDVAIPELKTQLNLN